MLLVVLVVALLVLLLMMIQLALYMEDTVMVACLGLLLMTRIADGKGMTCTVLGLRDETYMLRVLLLAQTGQGEQCSGAR